MNIDEYIASFSPEAQAILEKIRLTIGNAAPGARETISYGMPAFTLNGVLVYFAAFRKHIGFYPPVKGDAKLKQAASMYAGEKGSLRFPLDQPIPYHLIEDIVKLRVKQNLSKVSPARRGTVALVFLGLILEPRARAQIQFEVASVKPSTSGANGVRGGCHGIDSKYSPNETAAPPLGRCMISDGRLSHLISIAWRLPVGQIKGAPDRVISGAERFTIEAKADDPAKATEQELREMLQTLLAERFKLRFHREDRDMPGFALTVAKNGPKLQTAKADETVTSFGASLKPVRDQPISLNARRFSMAMLANLLSQIGPGPVTDETCLSGVYDFQLSWDENAGPLLVTALQEQLGLRFESKKVPVSFFVFESAQRPSGN